MKTDYPYLAQSLASLSGLPVRHYVDERFQGLYHQAKFKPDLAIIEEKHIFQAQSPVSYFMDENLLCYGLLRIPADDVALLAGPVAQLRIDRNAAGRILRRIGEPLTRTTELLNYFSVMPTYPLQNFLQILCTIHYFVNGTKLDVSELLLDKEMPLVLPAPEKEVPFSETPVHNTYELEQEMLSLVEHGRTNQVRSLFQQPTAGRAGTMTADALRQQKNLLICTATLVTRAAIRGGLDTETAFALSDVYIQKAELLGNFVDLTDQRPDGHGFYKPCGPSAGRDENSKQLLRPATTSSAISANCQTAALARAWPKPDLFVHVVPGKDGMTVNQYVTGKNRRSQAGAGGNGENGRRNIGISRFFSQSYFQNVFRKVCGMTPKGIGSAVCHEERASLKRPLQLCCAVLQQLTRWTHAVQGVDQDSCAARHSASHGDSARAVRGGSSGSGSGRRPACRRRTGSVRAGRG
jgi:AraC-like DNA-binding protein